MREHQERRRWQMTLRVVSESNLAEAKPTSLAQRFWSLVPERTDRPDYVSTVEHLLVIFERFRVLESDRNRESTIATLSLDTLLRQQEMQGDRLYASPEQLAGAPLTERSLVFTVGVLLFERLCDRHPFAGSQQPITLVRMRKAELGSSVNYLPRLPQLLRSILTRALSPLPEERFANLDELARALRWFVEEERRSVLPGAPPVALGEYSPSFADIAKRPISAFERAAQAGADEFGAPGIEELDPHRVHGAAADEQLALRLKKQTGLLTRQARQEDQVTQKPPRSKRPTSANENAPVTSREGTEVIWDQGGDTEPGEARDDSSLTQVRVRPRPTEARRQPAPSKRQVPTALWFALGVGATTAAFAIWTASRPAAVVQQAPARAAAVDQASQAAEQPEAAHPNTPDKHSSPVVTPLAMQVDAAGIFDPELAAHRALQAARICFDDVDARGLAFGVGMLFEPHDSHTQKIFFPMENEISWERRSCLHDVLPSVSAGAPPHSATAVELRLTVRAKSAEVMVKRVRH
jgi:hypothetical protein